MTTLNTYAKKEIAAGRFPNISIKPGEYGTFWLYDADWNLLDCKTLTSREAAEKLRTKAIEAAMKKCA